MQQVQLIFRNIKEKVTNLLIILGFKKPKSGNYYVSRNSVFSPWVFVSYIPDILCNKIDINELMVHQHRQEMIAIVNVLNELGYNVFVQNYASKNPHFPNINVKIVFGLEPLFEKACKHYPNALKIYYATGAYYEFQNAQVHRITDYVNNTYHCNLPYRRCVQPHDSVNIADKILQIGSKFTISTYPEYIQKKITCIHQSTLIFPEPDIKYAPENEFLYIASEGNILKGAFLVAEYFSKHQELKLNWVGPIEADVLSILSPKLTSNIIIHGVQSWDSQNMRKIVAKCNYVIYPSYSEGGSPGAVLCAMKCGLIPIVTRPAAMDEIDALGFLISDYSIEAIENSVAKALYLSQKDIESKKYKVYSYIHHNHWLLQFMDEFKMYIKNASKN